VSNQTEGRFLKLATTPLGIISLFVFLVETVLAVAAFNTGGSIQVALIVFVMAFPFLIAAAFFFVLWNRPYVFYPPGEFSDQTKVQEYVEAMQSRAESVSDEATKLETAHTHAITLPRIDETVSGNVQIITKREERRSWADAAKAAIDQRNFEEAYTLIESGLEEVSDATEKLDLLAYWTFHLYEKGWSEGFDKLKHLSQENPSADQPLSWLALIFQKAGQWAEAVDHYKRVRELASSEKERLSRTVLIAKVLVAAGLPNEALSELRQARALAQDPPEQAQFYTALGEVLLKIYPSKPLLGIACFEKALSIQPADTKLQFDVAYTHSEAITPTVVLYHYRKLLEVKTDPIAMNNAGVAAGELKLPLTGIRYFKLSAERGETLAMANLGSNLLEAGFEQEAREILEEARKEKEVHPNVDQWLGQIQKNRLAEEKKIEELDARVKKVLSWRNSEAEAIAQEQIASQALVATYSDSSGSILIVTASDDLMLNGEMTKADEILTLSGQIYGVLLSFSWKTSPAKSSAARAQPLSLLGMGFGFATSRAESGTGVLIIEQSGKILRGYRTKDDDPLSPTEWTLTRVDEQ
jgi:tetratricopeptide (TPR) repeat protein